MQPMSDETFNRVMSGSQDWQKAIQRYERDRADGTLTWDEHGKLVVPDHGSGCPWCSHIKAHTRNFQASVCASGLMAIHGN